ncbi:MAG TPA: hypothetical protein VFU59_04805, partial [Candidatus Eisenbacteria bacterium]|nr:hypothetical protein [Candidatus Eisenbacteria bacterium]
PDPARRYREFLARLRLCNALYGLMRSDVVRRTGKLGDFPGSDIVFLGELSLYGTFVEVPEYLFRRRFDKESEVHNATAENWQEFFEPSLKGKVSMRTWRHQMEYFVANSQAPISIVDKARIAGIIARNCISVRGNLVRELVAAVRQRAAAAAPRKRD